MIGLPDAGANDLGQAITNADSTQRPDLLFSIAGGSTGVVAFAILRALEKSIHAFFDRPLGG